MNPSDCWASLPADAITTTPWLIAIPMACRSGPVPAAAPSDMLITCAPFLTAYLTPRASAFLYRWLALYTGKPGSCSSSTTRTDRMVASGATPSTPAARPGPLPCPAISDAM